MANEQFKAGDVVALRSGGPDMSVEEVFPNGTVKCVWFPPSAEKPVEKVFRAEVLTKE